MCVFCLQSSNSHPLGVHHGNWFHAFCGRNPRQTCTLCGGTLGGLNESHCLCYRPCRCRCCCAMPFTAEHQAMLHVQGSWVVACMLYACLMLHVHLPPAGLETGGLSPRRFLGIAPTVPHVRPYDAAIYFNCCRPWCWDSGVLPAWISWNPRVAFLLQWGPYLYPVTQNGTTDYFGMCRDVLDLVSAYLNFR